MLAEVRYNPAMLRPNVRRLILSAMMAVCCFPAWSQTNPIRFHIRLSPEAAKAPVSGRLLVFLAPFDPAADEIVPGSGRDAHSVFIAARDVQSLAPGSTVEVNPDEMAYPAPFSTRPSADYQVMTLLDVNHDYAYAGSSPGDLRSPALSLSTIDPARVGTIDLNLTIRVPVPKIELPLGSEMLDFTSPALSAFWGRPIHMRGVIVLPPSYSKDPERAYPAVYWTQGFGGKLEDIAKSPAAGYSKGMATGKLPEMIYVMLDQSCAGGTHEFADSVNNGPWGKALTTELIPYLESKYRIEAKPGSRFLTGHSSGGWAALWLQVAYPEVFGGSWPISPDPGDFRDFTGPNLRPDSLTNFYRNAEGRPFMLVREKDKAGQYKDFQSIEDFAHQERVLGDYGGQMASFEWVFSPRGPDGRPQPLFNRDSGEVDPEVAKYWARYDVAQVLRENADRLRPLLANKIHLTVGTVDTYHLDGPAHLLEQTAKELNIPMQFTFVPGRDHNSVLQGGLIEQIAAEMEAVAHPKAK